MSDVEQIEIIAEAVDGSAGRRRWLQLRDEVSVSVSVSVCVCVCVGRDRRWVVVVFLSALRDRVRYNMMGRHGREIIG